MKKNMVIENRAGRDPEQLLVAVPIVFGCNLPRCSQLPPV